MSVGFFHGGRVYKDFREVMEASCGELVLVVIGGHRLVNGVVVPIALEKIDGREIDEKGRD